MLPALACKAAIAGLVSSGCTSFAKLVVVATAVAYVMLGIDEIGVQIENPFDILPQHAQTPSRSPGPSPLARRRVWRRGATPSSRW
jgi:hypothetical protein